MDINEYRVVPRFSWTLECIGRILASLEIGRKETDFSQPAKACSNCKHINSPTEITHETTHTCKATCKCKY